jgi:ubiquitin carboxyl-terminal hydrolase L3
MDVAFLFFGRHATGEVMSYQKHYVPLESDPDIFTGLMRELGVSDTLQFTDVWSIEDEDQLGLIPRPVLALIVIFPDVGIAKTTIPSFKTKSSSQELADEIIWFKQTINNACGLYAVLHAVFNSPAKNLIGM